MVAPGGQGRLEGIDAAQGSYRSFMERSRVRRFKTSDHAVTRRGDTAVVEYDWEMAWDDGAAHHATGREILVLSRRRGGWRVVWRTQISG
jgi:ketosteroid isomerase-like protein